MLNNENTKRNKYILLDYNRLCDPFWLFWKGCKLFLAQSVKTTLVQNSAICGTIDFSS